MRHPDRPGLRVLSATDVVAVAVRPVSCAPIELCEGKDPFFWADDRPHDARFGRGDTDGVPDGVDPRDVKTGVWVTDVEMAWVRWLSAWL